MERDSLRRLYEFDVMESVSDSRIFFSACIVTVSVPIGAYPLQSSLSATLFCRNSHTDGLKETSSFESPSHSARVVQN